MRSYMPGEHGWTDHGPRRTTHPAVEKYARELKKVRVKMRSGRTLGLQDPRRYRFGDMKHVKAKRSMAGTEGLVMVERSRRSDAEEDYLIALYEVFHKAMERLMPHHVAHLRAIMDGKGVREYARETDRAAATVSEGRQHALDALAKVLGAQGLADKKGIRDGIVRGTNFNITEFLPTFTEAAQ